uniref:SFRICE_012707 n=1 Tax=Spodoptera frugiperda TaxID=7108 RepID=A0A2H1W3L3_SPOFR
MFQKLFLILLLFVCTVLSRPNVAGPANVALPKKSNSLFAFSDDSPVWGNCPDGFQMDVNGVCREVWYEDYDN